MRYYLLGCVIRDAHLHIRFYDFFVKCPALVGFFILCHLNTSYMCVCHLVESSVSCVLLSQSLVHCKVYILSH